MTQLQKLREAFESRMTDNGKWPNAIKQGRNGCYLLAQTENAWTEWQACAEALALPTADHLPDAGKMINGLTQAETDASASVSGLTAAPVDERERFEQFAQNCPMGKYNVARRGEGYDSSHTQIMWDAWQARAAMSAGDAVDAQRYRWLMDNCTLGIKQNGVGWSLNTSACVAPDCIKDVGAAIDAAMRKDKP